MAALVQPPQEPKPRDRKTKPRCDNCRKSKVFVSQPESRMQDHVLTDVWCSFTSKEHGPWPARCEKCLEKRLSCSRPTLVSLRRNSKKPVEICRGKPRRRFEPLTQHPHVSFKGLVPTKPSFASPELITLSTTENPEDCSKEAIHLLSLHSILLMAVRDMIDMAVTMSRPLRRDAARECTEDCMPTLDQAVGDLKVLAYQTRKSMLGLSGGAAFARAQDALNALATPYFRPEFTWGVDQFALEDARASITWFHDHGHPSLVYVLQTKLLQAGVLPTRDEIARLLECKQRFAQALDELMARGRLPFSFPSYWNGCQMFAPRELVRVPAVASHILNDRRPDFLGRFSFHILSDAGASITWERFGQESSGNSVSFHTKGLRASVAWPIEALDSIDVLGRTALHIAVRQGSISSVMALSSSGANMHRLCLNGLSLLHIAACHGHATVVRHLIDKMHYHKCGEQCYTSTEQCHEKKTRCLFELDELDGLWRTPFWYAARGSHFDVMSLLTKGIALKVSSERFETVRVNIEHADSCGHSALAVAARDGRVGVLTYLLSLRSKSWDPVLEPLMPNEHLLLAYAVQSRSPECVRLVLSQRQWRFGGRVFDRAMAYANQNHDKALRDELLYLYKSDEAVRTINPVTGLNHHRPVDILGIDYTTDLRPFNKQFPDLARTSNLGMYPIDGSCGIEEPSSSQIQSIMKIHEDVMNGFAG